MLTMKMRVAWAALAVMAVAGWAQAAERDGLDTSRAAVSEIVGRAQSAVRSGRGNQLTGAALPGAQAAASEDEITREIVVFKRGVSQARRQEILSQMGSVTHDLRLINSASVAIPRASVAHIEAEAGNSPEIERIEPDLRQNWLQAAPAAGPAVDGAQTPDLEAASLRDRPVVPWGVSDVNASAVWHVTRGQGVKVAVVDTGVDASHPNLRVVGGANVINPRGTYADDHGHGTHVAGTIGARQGPAGVVGVAPEVDLYAVKVLDAQGSGTYSDIIAGIQWCAENGIQVANFSLGGSNGTQALEDAVIAAVRSGVTIVAAAGNSGGAVGYPGAYRDVIAVAAVDANGDTANFSSRGPEVALAAPGVDVLSTSPNGRYATYSGTSMATPHIAGLAALAIAAQGLRSPLEVRNALIRAARPRPGVPAEQQGAGTINAARLLPAAPTPSAR